MVGWWPSDWGCLDLLPHSFRWKKVEVALGRDRYFSQSKSNRASGGSSNIWKTYIWLKERKQKKKLRNAVFFLLFFLFCFVFGKKKELKGASYSSERSCQENKGWLNRLQFSEDSIEVKVIRSPTDWSQRKSFDNWSVIWAGNFYTGVKNEKRDFETKRKISETQKKIAFHKFTFSNICENVKRNIRKKTLPCGEISLGSEIWGGKKIWY